MLLSRTRLIAAGLAIALGCSGPAPDPEIVSAPGLRILRLEVENANVYLVEQGDALLMIDAGNPGDQAAYIEQMREHGIEPKAIDGLLVTHGHVDHAGTAAWFQEHHGIPLLGGAADQPMISAGGNDPGLCSTSLLARLIRWTRSGMSYPSFVLDRPLEGRFDLSALGMQGYVMPSPGHTPGSVVVIVGEHAFVGDLIRGGLLSPTTPATHFFMCDLDENRRRIEEVLALEGVRHWHPGHFGPLEAEAVAEYLE